MALSPGSRLGVYEITAPIGEGGMGQVWRATDMTLGRQVAIKILPDEFAADPERLARFEREARTLALLNHPHIAAIHGFEAFRSGGSSDPPMRALVMELVEGEDLSQRVARGAIPLDEALPIARQIAEALEAAHEQGIIHRDLKPANIKVRPDGTVKVLDFGLAKAVGSAEAGHHNPTGVRLQADHANSPTITTPAMTMRGMVLGTAAYMAPEQAKGKLLDRRADVWAFGAVLFEMLTGQRAFKGDDITDTIVAVVSKEPNWSALPPNTPPAIRKLLRRCLEKDRKRRLADAADARLEIDDALTAPSTIEGVVPASTPSASGGRMAWMVAAAALVGMAALAVPTLRHLNEAAPSPPPETRLDIVTPATNRPADFALSPDGRHIVFVASADGVPHLWLRPLATVTAQPLAGTEGASAPFWSPDSRSLGFFAGNALKRLDLGGTAQTLAPAMNGSGGTWSAEDVIVFAPRISAPLMRVSAAGGAVSPVTEIGPEQLGHSQPSFLPDGQRFLFHSRSSAPDKTGVFLGSLDGGAPIWLAPANRGGLYLPATTLPGAGARPSAASSDGGPRSRKAAGEGGWLLWFRAGTQTLAAQPFDVAHGALTGEPVTLADGVGAVAVSASGLVAYRAGDNFQPAQVTWVDRSGASLSTVGAAHRQDLTGGVGGNPRVSPDGRRVVVSRMVAQDTASLWLEDGARAIRLTFNEALDAFPVWSPDGTRIAFTSNKGGLFAIYQKAASGAGTDERLVASDQFKLPTSFSADGRFLIFQSSDPRTSSDLWIAPMAADRKPWVFLNTRFVERFGAFSPDGRWVAYQSNESGQNEIYVRPFVLPSPGASADQPEGQWQVSAGGGIMPAWRPDGRELYYLNPAGALMAAPITITAATLQPGAPVVLFQTRIIGGGVDVQQGRQYDVAPDGRFLINMMLDSVVSPITLIQNWRPGR